MPELVSISSDDFNLVIWTKSISDSQTRLNKTLSDRAKPVPLSRVIVNPAILQDNGEYCSEFTIEKIDNDQCNAPVFFENKSYEIEVIFNDKLKDAFEESTPRVEHRLRSIEDSFHYSKRTHSLRATINTGNDIGWFRFSVIYEADGRLNRQSFSFEVFPTKMDMSSDIEVMNSAIDKEFPLWKFSFAEKTHQSAKAIKKPHEEFLLLWLGQFERLFDDLKSGLKYIVNAPHSRLLPTVKSVKLDRISGKLPIKLEERIGEALASKETNKRFTISKKKLSVDTPENRFIKAVIVTTVNKLTKISAVARKNQFEPENQRLSDSFLNQLECWRSDINLFQHQPLFEEVGTFTGLQRESLVLQQKPGYSKVYKAWQQLKWYLDLLEGDSNLSLRNVASLYEIWCFLEVRRILLEELGFQEVESKKIPLINRGLDVALKSGMAASFEYKREDGVSLKLAHEPTFGPDSKTKTKTKTIRSWTTVQKPDIFLRATFPDKTSIVWLFDAKYRIDDTKSDRVDYVPEDAINQMHRYRDALIHVEKSNYHGVEYKSRPVFGAFALYPGATSQYGCDNPYHTEIEEVGIGAFSLLPSEDLSGSIWLTEFLRNKLGVISGYPMRSTDRHFVEEAPRIPYRGTEISRYNDLVLVANQLGPNRAQDYTERFKSGDARFYHTKQLAFDRQRVEHHVVNEARYLAVAVPNDEGMGVIEYLYPILHSEKRMRSKISEYQSGTGDFNNPNEAYWLFELGSGLKLKNSVHVGDSEHFEVKFMRREDLSSGQEWGELLSCYGSLGAVTG